MNKELIEKRISLRITSPKVIKKLQDRIDYNKESLSDYLRNLIKEDLAVFEIFKKEENYSSEDPSVLTKKSLDDLSKLLLSQIYDYFEKRNDQLKRESKKIPHKNSITVVEDSDFNDTKKEIDAKIKESETEQSCQRETKEGAA